MHEATYDNGTVVTYSYDQNGNRTAASVKLQDPETPTSLSATSISDTEIDLTWTGSSNATGYAIERCTGGSGCGSFSQVGTSSTASYVDTGLVPQTTYTYEVIAVDSSKGTSSPPSGPASAETGADTVAPTVPANLTASVSGNSISLAWGASTDNVDVSGYTLQRCQGSNCIDFAVTATSYTDAGLLQGATYQYQVNAFDEANNHSGWSNTATAMIAVTTPPNAPTSLVAAAASWSTVNLSWGAATDPLSGVAVAGYKIYRNQVLCGTSGGTSYTDRTTSPSTTYTYTVSAYDAWGNNSTQSAAASTTTPPAPAPSAPTGLSGRPTSNSTVTLTWNAASDVGGPGVQGYHVYRNGSYLGNTSGTSFNDSGLSIFSSYTYSVSAYDQFGTSSSQTSATVFVGYQITNGYGDSVASGYSVEQGAEPTYGGPSAYYWEVFDRNGHQVANVQDLYYEPACEYTPMSRTVASGYQLQGCDLYAAPSAYVP